MRLPACRNVRRVSPVIEPLENRTLMTAVTFALTTDHSSLTLSGTAGGATLVEQATGSLTTFFSGAIQAEVVGQTITFTGGSSIVAQTTGDWLPGGTAANYGASAQGAAGKLAIRDLALDITSGPVTISSGSIPSTEETIQFTGGTAAYDPGNGG